jgi:hypothetical protein
MSLVELAAEIPCTELKPLGDIPDIKLLGGVDLKAFVDITAGPPTDCKLTFNLLIQLAPLLASMTCLFKILNVISAIEEFATATLKIPDLGKVVEAVPKLVAAIGDLKECIPPLKLPELGISLKMMLQLIVRFLSCFLTQLDSLLQFRVSIDVAAADGNPVLKEALTCAENSADAAQVNLLKSLEPLKPLMDIVGKVAVIAKVPLTIPDFGAMSAGTDVSASIASVKQAVDTLQKAIDSIPG